MVANHAGRAHEIFHAHTIFHASSIGVPQYYELRDIVHLNGHFDRIVRIGPNSEMEENAGGRGVTRDSNLKTRGQRTRYFQDRTDALGLPTRYRDASSRKYGDDEKEQND